MKYAFIILLIGIIVLGGYFHQELSELKVIVNQLNNTIGGQSTNSIVVFYIKSTPTDFLLVPVIRTTEESPSLLTAMNLLLAGPQPHEELSPSVPPGTEILSLKIEEKIAVIDFSSEIKTNFIGGSQLESLLIEAIVKTVTQFHDIEKVRILIEGEQVESIAGHILINYDLP